MGLGLVSVALLGGCSSDEPPVPTEAQKKAMQEEYEAQIRANDEASKIAHRRPRPQ